MGEISTVDFSALSCVMHTIILVRFTGLIT